MKKGSEHSLWQYVRIGIQHAGDLVRLEAHDVGAGTPDVNYCIRGVEGNLELKYCSDAKRGFELRPTQYRWFQRRVEAGGNCWLLAEHEMPGDHWFGIIPGRKAATLIDNKSPQVWKEAADMVWSDRVDFDALINHLTDHKTRIVYVDRAS